MSKSKEFTLLELIVVVAIVGILISLLLPSLSKARIKAEQAVCLSNLKQLQAAHLRYTVENDYCLPSNRSGVIGGGATVRDLKKKSKIYAYLNDNHLVFKCPGDPMPAEGFTWRHAIKSYGFNVYMNGKSNDDRGWDANRMHEIEVPTSEVMGFTDEAGNVQNGFEFNGIDWVGAWHLKRYNASAMDGTAKSYSLSIPTSWTVVQQMEQGINNFQAIVNNEDHQRLKLFMEYKERRRRR